jgi:hypothetical protein
VANNTMVNCAQAVQVLCTYDTGNANECPPYGDPLDKARNTSVAVMNNVILDTPDNVHNDSHIRVCTNRSVNHQDYPYVLLDEQFERNVHFGANREFFVGGISYLTIQDLFNDIWTNYCQTSWGDNPADNPNLDDPAHLSFDLRTTSPISPPFMFTGGIRDAAYDDFEYAFPTFSHIYHDYDGHPYSGSACAVGAFGN